MKPATTFVAEFVGTSNVIRGDLAQPAQRQSPAVFDPPGTRAFRRRPAGRHEIEVSGLLHDIQYQGSATAMN
jgi:putative spermidine/putrescine transport system ATP-binding protein